MSTELAFIINVISSMYFMGGMIAQHEKAEKFIASLDGGFLTFLRVIKDQQPLTVIRFALKLFGIIAMLGFVGILLVGIFKLQTPTLIHIFSILFLVSSLLAGSLFWVLHHNEVFKQFLKGLLFFGGGSLLIPLMDFISGTNELTALFSDMLSTGFQPIIDYKPENNLLSQAMFVFGVYVGILFFLYIVSWVYAGPTAVLACTVIALPIIGARFINTVFPKQPIVFVFIAMWFYSLAYLTFA